jgi:hypothetical protein
VLPLPNVIPQPQPVPPPGLAPLADTVLNWLAWGAGISGVGGLLICSVMIIIGRRRGHQLASEGLIGTLYVAAGLSLAVSAAGLVGVFFR